MVIAITAVILHFGFGLDGAAQVLLGLIITAATLEAGFGFCVGCVIFGALMRAGLVSEQTCEACANVSLRVPAAA